MAQYGSYHYESTQSRALKSITADSYNKDQAKNLIQLNQNSEYMAQYLRKLQSGVDEANQNIIEQAQSFINDILVLLGGGGNTGLDFGDLKYVFQAIGSLFGFTNEAGEIQLPVNLFSAAWHFFSSYIVPGGQFADVINAIIDQAFAQLLELFGDIPIIGEALQQFAAFITDIRDALSPLLEAIETLFTALGGDWTIGDLGVFSDLFGALAGLFAPLIGPPMEALGPILTIISGWTIPFIEGLTNIITVVTNIIKAITGGLSFDSLADPGLDIFGLISQIVQNILSNLPFFPLSFLGNTDSINLIINPDFVTKIWDAIAGVWSWDGTQGHTANGSAKVTGNSADHIMNANNILVTEGQKLNISVWMKWASIAYSGSFPITFSINTFLAGAYTGTTNLTGPGGSPATTNATWTQYNSTFTVPAGCDSVAIGVKVASTVTAGQVWFDDASLKKSGDTLPQDWIFDLIPDLNDVRNFISDVIDTIISVIRGIPFIGGTLADLLDDLTDWFDDTQATAADASDALLGVQATQDVIQAGTTGVPTTGATDTSVQAALDAQANQIASQAAALAALQASLTAGENYGVSWADAFEYTNLTTLEPDLWDGGHYTEGSVSEGYIAAVDAHNAGMVKVTAGDTAATQFFVFQGPNHTSLTDYQNNVITVAGGMELPGPFFDGRLSSYDIYNRVNAAGTIWTRCRFFCTGIIQFEYINGGSITQLGGNVNTGIPFGTIGSRLGFETGVGAVDRAMRATFNGQPINGANYDDTSAHVTAMGALYRESGAGQRLNGLLPGKMQQFAGSDNKPAPVPGTQFRAYRDTATQVNLGSRGPGDFGIDNSYFTLLDYITPDLSWDSTNQILTCNAKGTYNFDLSYSSDSGLNASVEWTTLLYKDTGSGMVLFKRGGGSVPGANTTQQSMRDSFINIRLNAGDKIKPGIHLSTFVGACLFAGDTAGLRSEFSAVRVV